MKTKFMEHTRRIKKVKKSLKHDKPCIILQEGRCYTGNLCSGNLKGNRIMDSFKRLNYDIN